MSNNFCKNCGEIKYTNYYQGNYCHCKEDEAQEEVREKNKSNKHIGRDDS